MAFRVVNVIIIAGIFAAVGALAPASRANAQEAAGNAQAAESSGQLVEVTVTARRKAELLQDTPVSVTAVSGQLLDQLNVQDIARVAELAPNISIAHQPVSTTAATISIRGIGQTEAASTAEMGVGLYLDGVYIARTTGAVFDLVDLERVEVLRGPQGTLFGRNSVGGAVQLVSKRPADDFAIEEKLSYGRFSDWYSRTRLDTGLIGNSPFKATVAYLHRERDGDFDNTLAPDDKDPGSFDNDAVWVALAGEFGDRFSAYYSLDWNQRDGAPPFFQLTVASPDVAAYYGLSPTFGGAPFVVSRERLESGQLVPLGNRLTSESETVGHALTLEARLTDAVTLKSISSYRSFEQHPYCNLSGNGQLRGPVLDPVTFQFAGIQDLYGPYTCDNHPQRQHQVSEELQLLGGAGQWSYVAGLYYFSEKSYEHNQQRFTFVLPGGQAALNLTPLLSIGGETESTAGFGQVSYRPAALADKLELTAGARYTQDNKKFFSSFFTQRGDKDFSNTSWLASASYKFTRDVMGFARVSTGYKAGGFSARSNILVSYEPEKVTAYELGLKAEWFDRRLRTNLSVYQSDYKDLQVNQFRAGSGGTNADTTNAAEATIRGYELEIAARLADALTLDASYGYTDPKYDRYLFRDPVTNQIIDVSSQGKFSDVARETVHVGVEYGFQPFSVGRASARLDWSKRSRRYFGPGLFVTTYMNETLDPGTENLHARLALADMPLGSNGSWDVGLWGDNLTDHNNVGYGISFGGLGFGGVMYSPPRSYGIDVKLRF
ncbi:MAG: Vitamin B12 transporter BtuB [Steroidobacteraceae bacterium]|nr:Vitamin B12 transporter BtuB [Steroidobacteraceae bacterium]